MPQLLVSVRSVEEAAQALAGGADVIDVKEPLLGSLGRADDDIIADVVRFVAGRVPVSAALGELFDECPIPPTCQLSYVKCGLARCGRVPHWRTLLSQLTKTLHETAPSMCQFVHVAYADWECAEAPPVADVVDLACRTPGSVLLLDTHCKTSASVPLGRRPTLLDWLPLADVAALCRRCRAAQVRVALAGSLGEYEVRLLLPAQPTWFAVRGAACAGGREGPVQMGRVRDLAGLLRESRSFFPPEFR